MCSLPKSEKKPTLADIARQSEVSAATVSLVLRNKPGVGEETRRRVLDCASALGYVYSPSNQAHARGLPDQIGLIIKIRPDDLPATNSFYAPVLAGIETVCRRNQINLMYAHLLVDENNNPLETPRVMTNQEVDGLLMVGMHLNEQMVNEIERLGTPLVLVDAYADGDPFDSVVTDNFSGAFQATEHLIQQGHRHIGIVGSQPTSYPSVQERRSGYLQALETNALTPYFADCALDPRVAGPQVTRLLIQYPEVTALLACNDDVAIAAMRATQDSGKRVPEDLSIVGFDNIDLAQHTSPRLTTMRVDKMEMGRLATLLLMNRIEFPEAGRVRAVICPHIIERESSSPVKVT